MSTNSRLRMVASGDASGEAKKPIYCHWDGYPSHMLPILKQHYNTLEKVRELMELGDLSYLAERIEPEQDEIHSYDHPSPGVTVAYHRDRGEDLCFSSNRQHYNYLFDGSTWKVE